MLVLKLNMSILLFCFTYEIRIFMYLWEGIMTSADIIAVIKILSMNEVCVEFDSIKNDNTSRKEDKLHNKFCSLVVSLS